MEALAALGIERRQVLVLELADQLAEPPELPLPGRHDADDVPAAVERVALAHDQVARLELVEQRDEPARIDLQRVGDRRLGLACPLGQDGEDAVVVQLVAGLLDARDRLRAPFFCGRERLVDELVARFAERSLVGVVGPSGIGKSSLLRAGLLRALDDPRRATG